MLEEDTVWVHEAVGLSLAWPSAGEDLPAKQIVGYKREPPTIHAIGAIVAVNDTFTCYAIKNGLVRAIHRLSGETALLRGLTTDVIDLRFCPGLDRIAAVTKAGAWYMWDIKLAAGEVQVKEVFFSDRRPPQRPPTHPDAVLLAVIKDDTVVVAHNGLPCHALYFYVGGVLAMPAAVKVDSPIRALSASATTGQVLVGCEDGSVTSVSVPGRPGFGRSGSPVRVTMGAVTLVAPCANGYLVGGAATAEFHLLSGALQLLASLSLGAPPPSVHDASKPLLMTYEPSSGTIVIAASADPSTKGGSSLTFLRLRVPAPSVPETPSFVLAATRVPSERPVLNVACAYNPSEGTVGMFCVVPSALQCLTISKVLLGEGGVAAAEDSSLGGAAGGVGGGAGGGAAAAFELQQQLAHLQQKVMGIAGPPPGPPPASPPPPPMPATPPATPPPPPMPAPPMPPTAPMPAPPMPPMPPMPAPPMPPTAPMPPSPNAELRGGAAAALPPPPTPPMPSSHPELLWAAAVSSPITAPMGPVDAHHDAPVAPSPSPSRIVEPSWAAPSRAAPSRAAPSMATADEPSAAKLAALETKLDEMMTSQRALLDRLDRSGSAVSSANGLGGGGAGGAGSAGSGGSGLFGLFGGGGGGSSSGDMAELIRRLEALEALTKAQAQTTHQAVSAALAQSMSTLATTLAHAHAQQSDALALRMGVVVGEAVSAVVRTQLPPLLQAEVSGVKAIAAEVRTAVQELSRNLVVQIGQAVSQAATQAAVALGTALEASMLEALGTALEKRIAPRVEAAVEAAVTQSLVSLTTTASALPPQVAAAVTASVNARVSATVKEHFEGVLVPGYERASRALFEQLHGTFTQGVSAVVTEASAPLFEMLTSTTAQAAAHQEELLSDATAKLDAAIKRAAAEMTGAAREMAGAARRSANDATKATPAPAASPLPAAPPPPASSAPPAAPLLAPPPAAPPAISVISRHLPPSPPAAPPGDGGTQAVNDFAVSMELQALLAQGQVERAFAVALNASSLDLLLWLCGQLDPRVLGPPVSVSVLVLVSLATQLSAGLDAEPVKLKLSWLKAAFTLLNPTDPLIAPNIERILTAVRDNLKRAEARVPEGFQTDLAMLLFRVNKLSQARPA